MPRHIRLSELMSDQKFENFKIQVNRWRPTRVTKSLRILKSKLIDGGQLEN